MRQETGQETSTDPPPATARQPVGMEVVTVGAPEHAALAAHVSTVSVAPPPAPAAHRHRVLPAPAASGTHSPDRRRSVSCGTSDAQGAEDALVAAKRRTTISAEVALHSNQLFKRSLLPTEHPPSALFASRHTGEVSFGVAP